MRQSVGNDSFSRVVDDAVDEAPILPRGYEAREEDGGGRGGSYRSHTIDDRMYE